MQDAKKSYVFKRTVFSLSPFASQMFEIGGWNHAWSRDLSRVADTTLRRRVIGEQCQRLILQSR